MTSPPRTKTRVTPMGLLLLSPPSSFNLLNVFSSPFLVSGPPLILTTITISNSVRKPRFDFFFSSYDPFFCDRLLFFIYLFIFFFFFFFFLTSPQTPPDATAQCIPGTQVCQQDFFKHDYSCGVNPVTTAYDNNGGGVVMAATGGAADGCTQGRASFLQVLCPTNGMASGSFGPVTEQQACVYTIPFYHDVGCGKTEDEKKKKNDDGLSGGSVFLIMFAFFSLFSFLLNTFLSFPFLFSFLFFSFFSGEISFLPPQLLCLSLRLLRCWSWMERLPRQAWCRDGPSSGVLEGSSFPLQGWCDVFGRQVHRWKRLQQRGVKKKTHESAVWGFSLCF